jgi:hypothetical protein
MRNPVDLAHVFADSLEIVQRALPGQKGAAR